MDQTLKYHTCPICEVVFKTTPAQKIRIKKGGRVTCGEKACVSVVKSDAARLGPRKARAKVNIIPIIKMNCPWATGQIRNGNRIEMNPL